MYSSKQYHPHNITYNSIVCCSLMFRRKLKNKIRYFKLDIVVKWDHDFILISELRKM